jgi:hypothetical protein
MDTWSTKKALPKTDATQDYEELKVKKAPIVLKAFSILSVVERHAHRDWKMAA